MTGVGWKTSFHFPGRMLRCFTVLLLHIMTVKTCTLTVIKAMRLSNWLLRLFMSKQLVMVTMTRTLLKPVF